ncbi:MAG TPA: hypothetical protein VFI31_12830 [Pirellulales bacterium]|nr:hypothetical protein [Pirellulales bacterium]
MSTNLIHNRGRGPEIIGTRTTIYQLLPYFLDSQVTEAYLAKLYDLTAEQVAAARAYILNNADSVLSNHSKIESRIAAGNSPEVIETARRTHERFLQFKDSLVKRTGEQTSAKTRDAAGPDRPSGVSFPDFQDWLNSQTSSERS